MHVLKNKRLTVGSGGITQSAEEEERLIIGSEGITQSAGTKCRIELVYATKSPLHFMLSIHTS